jgi:PAS domain S-box-containing protein
MGEKLPKVSSGGASEAASPQLAGRIQPEALFHAVLDSAPDAIAVIDGGGRIVLANAQTERLLGYSAHELLGGPVERLLPEGLRPARAARRATHRASPRTQPMGAGLNLVARRKDGTEFPVEISRSPVATDDGMLLSAIIIRDVTEREAMLARERQALREAEESLALLGTILTAVPLGIAYVDSDLRYVYLNGAFAEISGTPAAEHLGRTAGQLPSARGPIVESLQRRVLETGRPVLDVAITAERPDLLGDSRQWRASGYPVSAPDGRVLGVGCVVQDVTESTRAEAERLKDDRANMVVHDLENPENGIPMMIQPMLRKRPGATGGRAHQAGADGPDLSRDDAAHPEPSGDQHDRGR